MNAPVLTFRQPTSPWSQLSTVSFAQSAPDGSTLPVLQGETSDKVKFRVYNNFALASNIASALNITLTTYDGVGAGSNTCATSPVSQSWVSIHMRGFGENSSTSPDLFTYFLGSTVAIGGSNPCGCNTYAPEFSSDGTIGQVNSPYIRAYSSGNGMGYIEFETYLILPNTVGATSYNFAINLAYEWVS